MSDRAVQLEIPAGAEFVALARLVVSAMASAETQLSDDRVDDLKIAVSEACTNAIEAHDVLDTEERVLVQCRADHEKLESPMEAGATGFDGSTLPDPPPVTDPERLK